MTSALSVNHLFTEAQQLPTAARAALAEKIVESIEADISPELEEAHLREIHRRQQEVRNGLVEMLPGESVLAVGDAEFQKNTWAKFDLK